MRTALRVAMAGLAAAAFGFVASIALLRAHDAELQPWMERWHRMPRLVLWPPSRTAEVASDGQLKRVPLRWSLLEAHELPGGGPVVSVVALPSGVAAARFEGGAWLFTAQGATPLSFGPHVNALAADRDGALYAATQDGAFRRSPHGLTRRLTSDPVQAVALWRGQPWFSAAHGLLTVDHEGLLKVGAEHGLTPLHPGALADCGAWLCVGADDGLWLFDGEKAVRKTSASGHLTSDSVTALAFGGGDIWTGTFDAGLSRLGETSTRRMAPADVQGDGRIEPRALAVGHGWAVAGTPTGLLAVSRALAAPFPADGRRTEVSAVAAEPRGFWLGSDGQVRLLALRAP